MIIKIATLHSPLPAGVLSTLDAQFDTIEAWLKSAGAEKVWVSAEELPTFVIMANFPALKAPLDRATPRSAPGQHRA